MNPARTEAHALDRLLKWTVCTLAVYWALFALLTPVTVWDSHTYNLARLPIAGIDGLFGNPHFVNERQIALPWSFDAIHLPMTWLDWGYGLPSYLSLVGIGWIIFLLVRRACGSRTAWLSALALLALPTVVFQATSTKNDLGLVFIALFALYSLYRFRENDGQFWLFASAAAIGFLPGIKTTGIALALLLTVYAVIVLRSEYRSLGRWLAAAVASFCLLGSLEIYVNNLNLYGNPLGSSELIRFHANPDGLSGAAANVIRYVFSFTNPWPLYPVDAAWQRSLEAVCLDVLRALNLADTGYQLGYSDATLRFDKTGGETGSDFGAFGMVAMCASAVQVLMFRRKRPAFRLAATGWLLLGVTAATVGWMPWNMRFLMLPAICFAIAALMWLAPLVGNKTWVFVLTFLFLLYNALTYPLSSLHKRPIDMVDAVVEREAQTLRERPGMHEVFAAVRRMHANNPGDPWLLYAGVDSWVLGLVSMPGPEILPVTVLNDETLARAAGKSASGAVIVLALNRAVPPSSELRLVRAVEISREKDSAIYLWWPDHRIRSVRKAGFSINREDLVIAVGDQYFKATENGRKFRSGLFLLVLDEEGTVAEVKYSPDFSELLEELDGRSVIGLSVHEPGSDFGDQYFYGRMTRDLTRLKVRPFDTDIRLKPAEIGFSGQAASRHSEP